MRDPILDELGITEETYAAVVAENKELMLDAFAAVEAWTAKFGYGRKLAMEFIYADVYMISTYNLADATGVVIAKVELSRNMGQGLIGSITSPASGPEPLSVKLLHEHQWAPDDLLGMLQYLIDAFDAKNGV